MQVFIETTSGLERRLTVGVPAERVENEVNSRLQKAARNVRLDGGSSPMQLSPYNLKRMTLYAAFMQQNRTRFSNAFGTRIK